MGANVLNWVGQADSSGNNAYNFGGTVNFLSAATITYNSISFTAAKIANVLKSNDVTVYNTNGAIAISGKAQIAGGIGLAGLTLAAPQPGALCEITISSLTSGNVVVTAAPGTTFDGTNNTATFNAVFDKLVLAYLSATQWSIVTNVSVVMSVV